MDGLWEVVVGVVMVAVQEYRELDSLWRCSDIGES